MTPPAEPAKKKPAAPAPPLWRQAFDVAERAVTPRAEEFVRTESFTIGQASPTPWQLDTSAPATADPTGPTTSSAGSSRRIC